MISHRGQIDKATNLVKEFITPFRNDKTDMQTKLSVGILNNKMLEQTEFEFSRNHVVLQI